MDILRALQKTEPNDGKNLNTHLQAFQEAEDGLFNSRRRRLYTLLLRIRSGTESKLEGGLVRAPLIATCLRIDQDKTRVSRCPARREV